MSNGDYDYFGKGDTGYAQYMTGFSRNISDFSSLIEELGRLGIKTKTGVLSPGFPSSRFCRILST